MSNYTLVRSILEVVGKEVDEYKAEIERLRRRVKELERTNNDDICRKVFAEHKVDTKVVPKVSPKVEKDAPALPPPIQIPEVVQEKPVKGKKVLTEEEKKKRAEYQKQYQEKYRLAKRKEKFNAQQKA